MRTCYDYGDAITEAWMAMGAAGIKEKASVPAEVTLRDVPRDHLNH